MVTLTYYLLALYFKRVNWFFKYFYNRKNDYVSPQPHFHTATSR